MDNTAGQIQHAFTETAGKVQNTADEMTRNLQHLDEIFQKISEGKGSMGQMLNDHRLYESLTDTIGKQTSKTLTDTGVANHMSFTFAPRGV